MTVKAKAATAINLIISFLLGISFQIKRLRMLEQGTTMQRYNSNKHTICSDGGLAGLEETDHNQSI